MSESLAIDDVGKFQLGTYPPVMLDRLAVDGRDNLLFASVIGDGGLIAGIRATLADPNNGSRLICSGLTCRVKGEKFDRFPYTVLVPHVGYTVVVARFAYGQTHAFIRTRSPSFLQSSSDEALWNALMDSSRYTTPLLREWIPWLRDKLIRGSHYQYASCNRCDVATLHCTDKILDRLVSEGLKIKALTIPVRTQN